MLKAERQLEAAQAKHKKLLLEHNRIQIAQSTDGQQVP